MLNIIFSQKSYVLIINALRLKALINVIGLYPKISYFERFLVNYETYPNNFSKKFDDVLKLSYNINNTI